MRMKFLMPLYFALAVCIIAIGITYCTGASYRTAPVTAPTHHPDVPNVPPSATGDTQYP